MAYFVFVTGGVISSVGKGVLAASLGALLNARGLSVSLRKADPYLNVDPGTMSPFEHGEVFITHDGLQVDLDFGHYERFAQVQTSRSDYITSGQVYADLLAKERSGAFLGQTIQMQPHFVDAVKDFFGRSPEKHDVVIVEIGGVVGDAESVPFLEAARQFSLKHPGQVCFVHVGFVPYVRSAGEYKTKPLQNSVETLQQAGIHPHVLVVRSEGSIPTEVSEKISRRCFVCPKKMLEAPDMQNIYQVPLAYARGGLDEKVLNILSFSALKPVMKTWEAIDRFIRRPSGKPLRIGLVGKYASFADSYKSLVDALFHASFSCQKPIENVWIDPEKDDVSMLASLDGVIVPGGFGHRAAEETLPFIRFARQNDLPFLGICLGMQLAILEGLRTVPGYEKALSEEFPPQDTKARHVITQVKPAKVRSKSGEESLRDLSSLHSSIAHTMHLGAYTTFLRKDSKAFHLYGADQIAERYRHRYHVEASLDSALQQAGFVVSAVSGDEKQQSIAMIERSDHPFFMGVQFHPEFISTPFKGHPLFKGFLEAAHRVKSHRLESENSSKQASQVLCPKFAIKSGYPG